MNVSEATISRAVSLLLSFLIPLALLGIASDTFAQQFDPPSFSPTNYPTWWFTRGVIAPNPTTNNPPIWPNDYTSMNDYSAINNELLKKFANGAFAEFQEYLPAGVMLSPKAVALGSRLATWNKEREGTKIDGYVSTRKLKALAKQFYEVLGSGSYIAGIGLKPSGWTRGSYPWSTNAKALDEDAPANIGQTKYLFSFDLKGPENEPPLWWMNYYGITNSNPYAMSDAGDFNTIFGEYQLHRNPNDFYNGEVPMIVKVSGDTQKGSPGEFVSDPLIVIVSDSSNNPLNNAPVSFTVIDGGLFQSSSISDATKVLYIRTDMNGVARAFFILPKKTNNTSIVTCTAISGRNTTNVIFTESSDDGNGDYISPFFPRNTSSIMNPDGSINMTWDTYADPNDTNMLPITYENTNGNTVTAATVPRGIRSFLLPFIH